VSLDLPGDREAYVSTLLNSYPEGCEVELCDYFADRSRSDSWKRAEVVACRREFFKVTFYGGLSDTSWNPMGVRYPPHVRAYYARTPVPSLSCCVACRRVYAETCLCEAA
jgi:hypothetical protein